MPSPRLSQRFNPKDHPQRGRLKRDCYAGTAADDSRLRRIAGRRAKSQQNDHEGHKAVQHVKVLSIVTLAGCAGDVPAPAGNCRESIMRLSAIPAKSCFDAARSPLRRQFEDRADT